MTAAGYAAECRRLSLLHHRRRLAWLTSEDRPRWADGERVERALLKRLIEQSRAAVDNPDSHLCVGGPLPGTDKARALLLELEGESA